MMRAMGIVMAIASISSGCAMADRISGTSLAREVQATGERADAVILEIWDTGITVNDDPVVGLRVRVSRADAPDYEATIEKSRVSRVHIPQVQPGNRVPVYVDPQNPARVVLGLYRH
jgi:hypothetical protein